MLEFIVLSLVVLIFSVTMLTLSNRIEEMLDYLSNAKVEYPCIWRKDGNAYFTSCHSMIEIDSAPQYCPSCGGRVMTEGGKNGKK